MNARSLTRRVQGALRRIGFDVHRFRPAHHYVLDYYGRSAHKQADIRGRDGFGPLARAAVESGRTLLYYDRLHTLYEVLRNVQRHRPPGEATAFAEVGVFRGGTSYFLASAATALGLAPFTLHACDTFAGHAAADIGSNDGVHRAKQFGDTSYDSVRSYLAKFPNVVLHQGRIQDTATDLGSTPFSFVHLDVDIYEPTRFALEEFDRRLVTGGAVVVDDCGFESCPGALRAVDEFVEKHPGYTALQLLTGQCLLVKP